MTIYYPAVIETDAAGGYGVFFPDLPGCVSAGDTQDEAAANAAEALALHLQGMLEDRDLPAPPSRLDDLARDPDVQEVARLLVAVPEPRLERVNVSFDGLMLLAIDKAAAKRGQTRSAFLKDAALAALKS
jgi:predicted RNase H-like HicB family nuclease